MTTRTTPSPIEILGDAGLRDAVEAGAAVIAFDDTLQTVLFADAAGAAFVSASSPALRQIRSATRRVAETGHARVSLRLSTRAGTRMLDAELTLRPADGNRPAYILATIAGLGRPLGDADLVEAAGLATEAAAVFEGSTPRFATAAFDALSPPDLATRLKAFAGGADSTVTHRDGGAGLTLVRAPFGRIVALVEVIAAETVEEAETLAPEPPAATLTPAEAPASGAPASIPTFSVKRRKLGEPRPGMSMSALLQRWHSRGPETGSTGTGETLPGPVEERVDPTILEASERDVTAEAPEPATVSSETAPAVERRLRSNWGMAEIPSSGDGDIMSPDATDSSARMAEAGLPDAPEETHVSDEDRAGDEEAGEASDPFAFAGEPEIESDTLAAPLNEQASASLEEEPQDVAGSEDLDEDTDAAADEAAEPAVPPLLAHEPVEPVAASLPSTDEASSAPAPVAAPVRPAFVPRFDVPPVRFVWQIDREGAFRFLSPDFAGAVGPNAADVVGRSFVTVARVFGFDETREIARLLERRDTWSGRTIFWPVEGSDRKVPVDLAALPVYGRDRSFDGFRGFGIVRLNEAVQDEEGLGLHLTQGQAPAREETSETSDTETMDEADEAQPPREKPFLRRFEAESFGRRNQPPAGPEAEPSDPAEKVIRLEERRRPRDGALSTAEEAAFRAIGAKLGSRAEAESPGALRFEEPAAPVSIDDAPKDDGRAPATAGPSKSGSTEGLFTSPPVTPQQRPTPSLDDDKIEPALEALAEKLARAEADADKRIAARHQTLPDKSTAPEAVTPITPAEIVTGTEDPSSGAPEIAADAETPTAPPAEREPASAAEKAREARHEVVSEAHPTETAPSGDDAVASAASEDEVLASTFEEPLTILPPGPETLDAATPEDAPSDEPANPADEEEAEEPPLDITVFERLFTGLPLAVLVQVREVAVYVNAAFAALTGHADVAAVEAAGGLDALVLDRQGSEGTLALLRADGEIVEVHAHMQRIAEGGRSALLMSFSPVADEAAAAGPALDDLRQEVEELQAVLDTATDGVVLLDSGGNIRAMNGSAHALFGIGADEAFGRHLSSLFAHESQKSAVDYLEMLRDDGIGGILNDGREVIGRVSQGGFIPLFITIGRLSGERGWCVVIRDIAHWKRIEEDLVNARRQAEAASLHKSRFLANISHELRTPLNAIIGFADVMSSECFGPIGNERYLEYLGDIKRSGHHVLDLVNDLLDISKIEAGKIDLSFEAVALNEVISEAVALMQPQANRERVIVRSNLPSSVPPVVADRRTMRQIALNLLANAIRFTPAGGQIIASTTYSAEGDVLLRFRDSGIGMTEREIELALTPFQQVHAPSANRGEGTGLGLPLTKAMVEANRAYFSIQSTPGEGTLVEIVFPAPRVLAD